MILNKWTRRSKTFIMSLVSMFPTLEFSLTSIPHGQRSSADLKEVARATHFRACWRTLCYPVSSGLSRNHWQQSCFTMISSQALQVIRSARQHTCVHPEYLSAFLYRQAIFGGCGRPIPTCLVFQQARRSRSWRRCCSKRGTLTSRE